MSVPFQSGWCVQCGRRRGPDGRCSNCDPWWTSPLIQVGGPIVAVFALLMAVLVTRFGNVSPQDRASSFSASGTAGRPGASPAAPDAAFGVLSAPGPSGALPSPASPTAFAAPAPATTPAVTVFPAAPPPPAAVAAVDPDRRALADLEALRAVVWQADALARGRAQGTFVATPHGSGPATLQAGM